jgi:hypothetical protein
MSTKKLIRTLRREYPTAKISYTNGGHIRLSLSDGRFLIMGASTSDHRVLTMVRNQIRKELRGVKE